MNRLAHFFIILLFLTFWLPAGALLASETERAPPQVQEASLSFLSYGPASGDAPRQLVVILHGLGDNNAGLLWLAAAFSSILPDALFILPEAPFARENGEGFQWFTPTDDGPLMQEWSIIQSYEKLDALITEQLAIYGLDGEKALVLCGFSQGAALSLYTGLRRPAAAVISFSGMLIGDVPSVSVATGPIFLLHGDQDQIIPVYHQIDAINKLRAAGMEVISRYHSGMAHMIHKDGLLAASLFLNRHFFEDAK